MSDWSLLIAVFLFLAGFFSTTAEGASSESVEDCLRAVGFLVALGFLGLVLESTSRIEGCFVSRKMKP